MTSTFKTVRAIAWNIASLAFVSMPVAAQFTVFEKPIEMHGFASQGFVYSNANNYLTMSTSKGSFAFTDGGFNVSSSLTDRFRVGAQVYVRNIGSLGRGQVKLDWALGDYRMSDNSGFRVGKIKTIIGLYNDTQDVESLHTWAILPQSVYPLDLRESSLAHLGGDFYSKVFLPRLGTFSYALYAGSLSSDPTGGYILGLRGIGLNTRRMSGTVEGGDLKWNSPLPGLLLGTSFLHSARHVEGLNENIGQTFRLNDSPDYKTVFSARYSFRNLRLDAETSRTLQTVGVSGLYGPDGMPSGESSFDRRAWYAAAAYRFSSHVEVGTYHSRFFPNADRPIYGLSSSPAGRHVFDQAFSLRIDMTSHWDIKVEGHLIDGYGDVTAPSGFYIQQNGKGLQAKTNLFVLRTGFSF